MSSPSVQAKSPAADEGSFQVGLKVGKGVWIRAPHDYLVLHTRLRAQFLYAVERDAPGEAALQSFQIRRARLTFSGHMLGKHNRFKVEFAFSPRDLGIKDGVLTRSPLLDWYMQFTYLRELNLRIGQYKVPFTRERVISSGNQGMVDRSIVNSEFNLDRDVGLDLRAKDFLGLKKLRYAVGVFMGEGHSSFAEGDFSLMYLARIEVLPFNTFKDYDPVDHKRNLRPKLSLGLAYGFLDRAKKDRGIGGSTPADGGTTSMHLVAADLLFKWRGFSLQSEFVWRQGTRNPGTNKDEGGQPVPVALPRNGLGWFAMFHFLIPRIPLGIAARYALIRPMGADTETSLAAKDALGFALSYYFIRHSMKLQVDYFHIINNMDLDKGEDRVRVMLQAAL